MENREIALSLKGVSKAFPGVKALDNVQFELRKGEVHALIGENGAGKSTLIKIISGLYTKDAGEIMIDGKINELGTPHRAQDAGIAVVYQELSNFPDMSIAENIAVGLFPINKIGAIDYKAVVQRTKELLAEFDMESLDPNKKVRDLSVGRQQLVEILKALGRNSKILILDEPTSALTTHETDLLFKTVKKLQARGVSIIYISHRLDELYEICDRVTIFRDGTYIDTLDVAGTTKSDLVKLMVGRDVAYEYGAHTTPVGEVLFDVTDLSYSSHVKNVSFQLRAGEVLGIAGLEGAGRTELAETLFGVRRKSGGKTVVCGKEVNIANTLIAKQNNIAYITKDRKQVGLFLDDTIDRNIISANLDKFVKHKFINFRKASENSAYYWKRFNIRTPSLKKIVRGLSGGNQQKVLLAMWFTRNPKILIIDEPTRGIDVGAKEEIHRLIRQLAAKGAGIIMITSDLPELLGASDRIMVMYEGSVTSTLENNASVTEDQIVALSSGIVE